MGSGGRNGGKGSVFCSVKYVFIVFNFLVWLLGLGVLFVGVWVHVNQAPYSSLLPNTSFLSASVLIICLGAITLLLGFCGCCGAILESQCMLIVYFVFMLVVFGLEVAATALAVTYKEEVKDFFRKEVILSLKRDYSPDVVQSSTDGVVAIIDNLQQNLQCCGIDNETDWYKIDAWPDQERVPVSCCVEPVKGCGDTESNAPHYTRGCMKEVEYWFYTHVYMLGILALVLGVVQVLAMTAAVSLFCCLRKNKSIL